MQKNYSKFVEIKLIDMLIKKIFLLLFLASNLVMNAQNGFTVTKATKQSWAGGQPMTGFGTNYVVHFITTCNSNKLEFGTFWVGERYYNSDYFILNKQVVHEFKANDTLSFQVSFRNYWGQYQPDGYNENYNIDIPPIDYNGEALIEYTYKGKKHYYIIHKLEELEYLAYP